MAVGAANNISLALFNQEVRMDANMLDATDPGAGLLDLGYEKIVLLVFFWFEVEIPRLDLGPGFQLRCVKKDPYSIAPCLFIEREGKAAQIDHLEPAIAYSTRCKNLYGIRKTFSGFTESVVDLIIREMPESKIDHESSNDDTGGTTAMEGFYQMHIFIK